MKQGSKFFTKRHKFLSSLRRNLFVQQLQLLLVQYSFQKEFICSATVCAVCLRVFWEIFSSCRYLLFRENFFVQLNFDREHIQVPYFSENSGLFRFVSKQFCLFRLFRYRFETLKQTEKFFFWFHETNRNKRETDLVSVCFGSNRNFFFFVSRTPYCQCTSCNGPGFDPIIRRNSGI